MAMPMPNQGVKGAASEPAFSLDTHKRPEKDDDGRNHQKCGEGTCERRASGRGNPTNLWTWDPSASAPIAKSIQSLWSTVQVVAVCLARQRSRTRSPCVGGQCPTSGAGGGLELIRIGDECPAERCEVFAWPPTFFAHHPPFQAARPSRRERLRIVLNDRARIEREQLIRNEGFAHAGVAIRSERGQWLGEKRCAPASRACGMGNARMPPCRPKPLATNHRDALLRLGGARDDARGARCPHRTAAAAR